MGAVSEQTGDKKIKASAHVGRVSTMASYPSPPSHMTPEWAQFLEADIVRAPSWSQNPD